MSEIKPDEKVTAQKMISALAKDRQQLDRAERLIHDSAINMRDITAEALATFISRVQHDDNGFITNTSITQQAFDDFLYFVDTKLSDQLPDAFIRQSITIYEQRLTQMNLFLMDIGYSAEQISNTDLLNFSALQAKITETASTIAAGSAAQATAVARAIVGVREAITGTTIGDLARELQHKAGVVPKYAFTIANTSLMSLDRTARFQQAEQLNYQLMKYVGPDDELTRPFCENHLNKVLPLSEWQVMTNDTGPQPVSEYCGGYNCRHRLIMWSNDWEF